MVENERAKYWEEQQRLYKEERRKEKREMAKEWEREFELTYMPNAWKYRLAAKLMVAGLLLAELVVMWRIGLLKEWW